MSWCITAVANGLRTLWSPHVRQVRFRYHKDKVEAGPLIRRYGYEERILNRGLLPRVKTGKQLPCKQYIAKDNWTEDKARMGQNDYIDIFNENLHPSKLLYEVPHWLRGFQGTEYQVLLRKRKMLAQGSVPIDQPTSWRQMNRRIRYLYKYLNTKTRTWFLYGSRYKP